MTSRLDVILNWDIFKKNRLSWPTQDKNALPSGGIITRSASSNQDSRHNRKSQRNVLIQVINIPNEIMSSLNEWLW